MYETPYDEIPVQVIRDGQTLTVIACDVNEGDFVRINGHEIQVVDTMPDEDEGIFYIAIDSVNMVPAALCEKR